MISGIENYSRAIEFRDPEYLPCFIEFYPDLLYEKDNSKIERIMTIRGRFPNDLIIYLNASIATKRDSRQTVWRDEWGTGWRNDGHGAKTETYPLGGGYNAPDKYLLPDPRIAGRFEQADKILKERGNQYVCASVWFTLFERLWMLRGFENMLMDPYVNEKEFCALRDRIVEYNLAIIEQWLERGVNGVFFSDDWGGQRNLLINPDDWRRFYKPSYKRMFNRVRSGGAHVWMHLCGNITAILPDLIDIGLNVLNPIQPQAMNIRQLSKEYGGKICFFGGVDVQDTLINGTPEKVKREVHALVELFGRFNGGYIGGTSHGCIMSETPLDNIYAMYEAFLEHQPAK